MPVVKVSFTPAPAHVRTVRLVAGAAAQQAGMKGESLEEVRLAVGEACAQAVARHQRHGLPDSVRIECEVDRSGRFVVRVSDSAPPDADGDDPVAAALLSGLARELRRTRSTDPPGTTVHMNFPVKTAN